MEWAGTDSGAKMLGTRAGSIFPPAPRPCCAEIKVSIDLLLFNYNNGHYRTWGSSVHRAFYVASITQKEGLPNGPKEMTGKPLFRETLCTEFKKAT